MSILLKLHYDKIAMNWNKNPIKMLEFLSFLKVPVVKSTDNLGIERGWTEYTGDNRLVICGGWVRGVEYLNTLKYKTNLHNPYNNYVGPFHIFDILTDEGKKFFLEYYKDDIHEAITTHKARIAATQNSLKQLKLQLKEMNTELSDVGFSS